ncbi:MAG: hypothetical protein AAGB11_12255 [Pseudomonadota bacterium]
MEDAPNNKAGGTGTPPSPTSGLPHHRSEADASFVEPGGKSPDGSHGKAGALPPGLAALEASALLERDPASHRHGLGEGGVRMTQFGRELLERRLCEAPGERSPNPDGLVKALMASEGDGALMVKHVRAARDAAELMLKRYRGVEAHLELGLKNHPNQRLWLKSVRGGIARAQAEARWCHETLKRLERSNVKGEG